MKYCVFALFVSFVQIIHHGGRGAPEGKIDQSLPILGSAIFQVVEKT